jgi:hypothetical protein
VLETGQSLALSLCLVTRPDICLVENGINIYRGYASYHNHHLASRYDSEDLWL